MSVWNIELEQQEVIFGDAAVSLYMIQSDRSASERELIHCHSFYEIHVILRGMYEYSIDGRPVPVRAGEMVIIPPDLPHKAVLPFNGMMFCVLPVSVKKRREGERVYDHLIRCLDANVCKAIPLGDELVGQITAFDRLPRQRDMSTLLHNKLAACRIVVELMDVIHCSSPEDCSASPVDFDIMLETLVKNSEVSLSEIARRLGYSERQISRKIKARYGKTFSQIRREKK